MKVKIEINDGVSFEDAILHIGSMAEKLKRADDSVERENFGGCGGVTDTGHTVVVTKNKKGNLRISVGNVLDDCFKEDAENKMPDGQKAALMKRINAVLNEIEKEEKAEAE